MSAIVARMSGVGGRGGEEGVSPPTMGGVLEMGMLEVLAGPEADPRAGARAGPRDT